MNAKTAILYRPVGTNELALIAAGGAGYATRLAVRNAFLARYSEQQVGAAVHRELWIPAEALAEMNRNIVGRIERIAEYKADART